MEVQYLLIHAKSGAGAYLLRALWTNRQKDMYRQKHGQSYSSNADVQQHEKHKYNVKMLDLVCTVLTGTTWTLVHVAVSLSFSYKETK